MNYIMTVINPDALKKLSDICAQLEIPMSVALHGRGTAIESMRDLLGIDSTEKWIVFSVAGEEKTKEYMNRLRRTLYIGVPGHGIAWAVPIKSVGGGKILAYLNDGRQDARYTPEFNFSYELIVAIANEGRTDAVMNAARAAGAMGGTVLHGKGTTSPESEKFLGVSIAKEKEGYSNRRAQGAESGHHALDNDPRGRGHGCGCSRVFRPCERGRGIRNVRRNIKR